MKNYRLPLLFIVLAAIAAATYSCNKYKDDTVPPPGVLPEDKTVTASLQGRVLDEKGVPMQGAAVTSGTAATTTDVNGTFYFKDISLYSRFGTVNVTHQGYFMGSRTFVTSTSALNFVEIHMLPRTSPGSFDASTGGTINVSGGQSVTFAGGIIVNAATNAVYSGHVNAYATYLDPTDKEALKRMPGDLRGITTDKKEVALRSFGMMKVELEGDGGEKLQIAPGKTADISFTIPTALQTGAPDTIPLWHFNDTTGKWMQEGKAAKKGNAYVGQVSHFSWWNIDLYYTAALLKARFKDQNGRSLADKWVMLSGSANSMGGGTKGVIFLTKTDSMGAISIYVPVSQVMPLRVEDMCGNIIGGANVGPLVADMDMGTITMQLDDVMLNLSGDVVDCTNNPVANGFVTVYVDNLTYRAAVNNGKFSLSIHRCYSAAVQAQFIAGDNNSSQQGSMTSQPVTKGDVNVGQLSACGVSFDEFINMTFNGKTYSFTNPPDAFSYSGGSSIDARASSPVNKEFYLYMYASAINGTGSFTPTWLTLRYGNFRGGSRGSEPAGAATLNVTDFGPVNGFITGTFGGNIADSVTLQIYPLTGTFKIKRTN